MPAGHGSLKDAALNSLENRSFPSYRLIDGMFFRDDEQVADVFSPVRM